MAKTFLQICKDVCRECDVASGESAILTTVSQTGMLGKIVNYVRQSWIEIQNVHQHSGQYWRWMRSSFTITTVSGQSEYDYGDGAVVDSDTSLAISRFRNWMIKDFYDPPKSYLQASGVGTEGFLTYLDWNDFKYLYRLGTQNSSRPAHVSITPQNKIVFGPTPNDEYIITGDYMLGAQIFSADDDEPDLPESFQEVIMFKAISKYGLNANAIEKVTAGEDGAATYLGALEGDQLSELPIAGPMA